jgi:hypothetical protein
LNFVFGELDLIATNRGATGVTERATYESARVIAEKRLRKMRRQTQANNP